MPDTVTKPRKRQARAEATRNRLLDATIAVLTDAGYAGTTTTAVCKRAKCSRGQLLHHFPNREALLVAALFRVLSDRVEGFVSAVRGPLAADEFIETLWGQWQGDAYIAWLELAVASRTNASLRVPLQEAMIGFDALITEAFDALVPDTGMTTEQRAQLPFLLFGAFNGLAIARIYEPPGRGRPRIDAIAGAARVLIPGMVGEQQAEGARD